MGIPEKSKSFWGKEAGELYTLVGAVIEVSGKTVTACTTIRAVITDFMEDEWMMVLVLDGPIFGNGPSFDRLYWRRDHSAVGGDSPMAFFTHPSSADERNRRLMVCLMEALKRG